MISDIEEALEEVRTAISLCEEVDTLRILRSVEEKLKNWLYTYVDDGK